MDTTYPKNYIMLFSLGLKLQGRFQNSGQILDLEVAIDVQRLALKYMPDPHPDRSGCLNNLAAALGTRFEHGGELNLLKKAIELLRQALKLWPHPDQNRSMSLINLAKALEIHFKHAGRSEHLEEAIDLHRQALKIIQRSHPDYFSSLRLLARTLTTQFEYTGRLEHLKEAIGLYRHGLKLIPHPRSAYSNFASHLTDALRSQFDHSGGLEHLKEAIDLCRHGLELMPHPHPNRLSFQSHLGNALRSQFENFGGLEHLEEAINLHRQALKLMPHSHPYYSSVLNNLANALRSQYKHSGGLDHIEQVIDLHKQALKLRPHPHPGRFLSLHNLANALTAQFDNIGGLDRLEEAIYLHRQALQLIPHPHPNYSSSLSHLTNALRSQFMRSGRLEHLEEAIYLCRQALKLMPHSHPSRSTSLDNLAKALRSRFEHNGRLEHLEEAIVLLRQALKLRPHPHPDHSSSLSHLANALKAQFEHGGGLNFLKETIELHKQALRLRSHPHPGRPMSLHNLAATLATQFVHDRDLNCLKEAIELQRQSLKYILHSQPNRSHYLLNMGSMLRTQFQHSGGLKYLEESIEMYRQALKLVPHPHPARSSYLTNLATALETQFKHGGGLNILEESIQLLEPILQLSTKHNLLIDLSPSHALSLDSSLPACHNLGKIYITAYDASGGASDYLNKSILSFSAVVHFPFSSPFSQIRCAMDWAKYADKYHHTSAMEAYDLAIRLLPQSSSSGYSTYQQQRNMVTHRDSRELASSASHYAIRMQRFDKAIEYQEAARALLWSQLHQLRSPFDHSSIPSALGRRLGEIARVLEKASHNESLIGLRMADDNEGLRLSTLSVEWKEKLDEVRKIPGLGDFLLPRRLSSLQEAATTCPIAVLIPHADGSACLIMTSATIYYISIPGLTIARLRALATIIQQYALNSSRTDGTDKEALLSQTLVDITEAHIDKNNNRLNVFRTGKNKLKRDDVFRVVLKELWEELVKPVIDILRIQKSNARRPTIQWCPTGLFTFLPIHAAGIYTENAASDSMFFSEHVTNDCASDYIISSYAPTIGALLSPKPSPPLPSNFKVLAVAAGSNLRYTKQEIQNIRACVPEKSLTVVGMNGIPSHVDTVFSHLSTSSIVHFACHGTQDKSNPLDSGLALDDGLLTISTIMKQPLPNGSLAFLCACETGMGDAELPDEAMSIGASMVFAGFQNVIATMWTIMDQHGPTVANAFYEELFRGSDGDPMSVPDFDRTAQALDYAVRKLRNSGVPFHEWVPFIHLGKAT